MAIQKVKVWALKDSLRLDGIPYCKGDALDLPEYMVKEWLSLGLVSRTAPDLPATPEEKPKENKPAGKPAAAPKIPAAPKSEPVDLKKKLGAMSDDDLLELAIIFGVEETEKENLIPAIIKAGYKG